MLEIDTLKTLEQGHLGYIINSLLQKLIKKTFPRLYSGQCKEGPWTKVLEKELEDPREQQDPLPLQVINLDKEATGQFLKFELLSWWGWNGGLMYFSIYHADKA